ncbi:MAG: TolC family protein [Limisphaerales bacterium]
MKRTVVLRSVTKICFQALACTTLFPSAFAQTAPHGATVPGPTITLRQAFDEALLQNRELQIQRIEQEVANLAISGALAYYDPVFTSRAHLESATDTGGFDPANFSADAIFSADSEVVSLGLLGFLPSGLSYTIGGNYAHSYGTRNFLNFDSYKVGTGITLEQPLLRNAWIDAPRWLIQVNKQNLKISELGVLFIAMSVVSETQQAYYDLAFAWENLQIQNNLFRTKQDFLSGIRQQVQFGVVTALEEKLAQSQAASTRTDLIGASNAVALASNNLRTLMGTPTDHWTTQALIPSDKLLTIPEIFDLSQSWRSGLRLRPDLLQLAINLETADLTMKFRKNQLLPSLNLFGSYGLKGSDAIQAFPPVEPTARSSFAFQQLANQDAPNSAVGVLFSVPLSSRAERANYKTSKEHKKQAELLLKQKEEFILREVADAIDVARFSYQRADAAREAVQFAEEALRAEESRRQSGAGSIFLVLEAQSDLAAARSTEAAVRRDYNKAISQLYFAEGSLLDRIQLDVRFR